MKSVTRNGKLSSGTGAEIPGWNVESMDLLSLPLSSKGGEGNSVAAGEHRDPRMVQGRAAMLATHIGCAP
jgi:hypothetical protein